MSQLVLAVAGTRPEVIKLAPLAREFAHTGRQDRFQLCAVSQQFEILEKTLEESGVVPGVRVDYGSNGAAPPTPLIARLRGVFRKLDPDWIVVQGDTTTALAAAIAAAEDGRRCAHVEAGLRTGNPNDPFPEEFNRVEIAKLATLHFAPTAGAKINLIRESVDPQRIRVVGNTGIDALARTLEQYGSPQRRKSDDVRTMLVTGHRRENHGDGVDQISTALERLIERFPSVRAHFVLHPNPNAHEAPMARLAERQRVSLLAPLDHAHFIEQLANAYVVLTDSGGVQEEAPYLGTPVLITRFATERPEALDLGTARLVGNRVEPIVDAVSRLLEDDELYARMSRIERPFGDGCAAGRIHRDLQEYRE